MQDSILGNWVALTTVPQLAGMPLLIQHLISERAVPGLVVLLSVWFLVLFAVTLALVSGGIDEWCRDAQQAGEPTAHDAEAVASQTD